MDGKQEIQTRSEFTRSLEDAEKYKAINSLSEIGLLTPMTQIRTHHGRVAKKGETWLVDRTFANQGNKTGNANVNERNTLYTADEEIAREFARARGSEIVESLYLQSFEHDVRNYSQDERREWLAKVNQREVDAWKALSPEQKENYSRKLNRHGPTVHPETILENNSEAWREARRLETEASEEEKKARWAKASQDFSIQIHQILSSDPDATVIDFKFDPAKLTEPEKEKYFKALEALAIPITEGSPVEFRYRDATEKFIQAVNDLQRNFILKREVAEIAAKADINEETALQLASSFNSRQIALRKPSFLADRLLRYPSDIITEKVNVNEQEEDVPFNLEYAARYVRQNHIIGARQPVDSATLGKKVDTISFFDLGKIGTKDQLSIAKAELEQRMVGLIDSFPEIVSNKIDPSTEDLVQILNDAHARPEQLIEAAKKVEGYQTIFKKDVGNWEGFTLEEHTETVLRNFEENFADIIPVEYLKPMRLAIISHDLGKPEAVAKGEKHKQQEYNQAEAAKFLGKVGLPANYRKLILAIIGDGSNLAFNCQLRPGDENTFKRMKEFAQKNLSIYLNTNEVDDPQITAFTEMCKIFQTCDGGAYTSMAITRRSGIGRFRNAPSFNDSFSEPIGLGKRDIKYKQTPTP